jgi:hypothetical protein
MAWHPPILVSISTMFKMQTFFNAKVAEQGMAKKLVGWACTKDFHPRCPCQR